MLENKPTTTADGTFVITRVFSAPRHLVWAAWSGAEQMQKWWGPKGCSIKIATFEFRPGGFFHYAMQYSNGPGMWGRFLYRDVAAQERIVWLNSFSNPGCGITRAPFNQSFPLEMLNDVAFTEKAGKTTVTLHARPHGAEPGEVAVFEGMFASLNQGFGGTFDQLEAFLAKA
jgi:uncharacterized protein YndB with AHSA1/START domain